MKPDLSCDANARRYSKRQDTLLVEIASASGVLATLEGDIAYAPGDALVTGPAGDRWPVGREHFDTAYIAVPPTIQGQSGHYRRRANVVWAKQMTDEFEVTLGARGVLRGKAGDWLVQYAPADQSIVAESIFAKTYVALD
ncbi:PGDYG domain-containing protein [Paraburkholderia lycopersici]|uniref:PGDYG protein n=1 Tax=Paraburkholderia lycopersici TaxID=416944 RepID=A0A1G6PML8_9BURK|nr:PGDYG domain-containing protein [Paraburkholderia lycopersici]SDC81308.1 PGDYG protein [Paraburkholderia lycopersici]